MINLKEDGWKGICSDTQMKGEKDIGFGTDAQTKRMLRGNWVEIWNVWGGRSHQVLKMFLVWNLRSWCYTVTLMRMLPHGLKFPEEGELMQRTFHCVETYNSTIGLYFFVGTATQLVNLPPHIPRIGQWGGILLLRHSMICVSGLYRRSLPCLVRIQ